MRLHIIPLLLATCISMSAVLVVSSSGDVNDGGGFRANDSVVQAARVPTPIHSHPMASSPLRSFAAVEPSQLPVALIGADRPEAISDALAMRLFIRAIAVSASASADEVRRRDALLSNVGFSEADYARFVQALQSVKDQLNDIERARGGYSVTNNSHLPTLDLLRTQERDLLDSAAGTVLMELGADGRAKFQRFIRERVKRRITIYGSLSAEKR
jgi:hypothetical protein